MNKHNVAQSPLFLWIKIYQREMSMIFFPAACVVSSGVQTELQNLQWLWSFIVPTLCEIGGYEHD